jgi:ribosomal 30S subunit maturation factor RimM
MIRLEEIAPIGIFGKTHGIKGEINLELNIDFDLEETPYIIVDIDLNLECLVGSQASRKGVSK